MFGDALLAIGARRPDVVAITAAMLHPTGLAKFAAAYPDRVFDVGIAEQHAVTSAAGLAMGGLHPVVAIYATFLNRAFDQVLMDVALHRLPVTFVLDRAGVTGPDGASHNGMWDGSILQVVPGPADRRAAGRDPARRAAGRGGGGQRRTYRGAVPQGHGGRPRSRRSASSAAWTCWPGPTGRPAPDVLLVGAGPMAVMCLDTAGRLADQGIGVTVVDPRWVKPVDPALADDGPPGPAGGHGRGQRRGRRVRRRGVPAAARR